MDKMPSDNLDNLLLVLSKIEYRDFVGIKKELAEKLIILNKTINTMLDLELKSRTINEFMAPVKKHVGLGTWPGG